MKNEIDNTYYQVTEYLNDEIEELSEEFYDPNDPTLFRKDPDQNPAANIPRINEAPQFMQIDPLNQPRPVLARVILPQNDPGPEQNPNANFQTFQTQVASEPIEIIEPNIIGKN